MIDFVVLKTNTGNGLFTQIPFKKGQTVLLFGGQIKHYPDEYSLCIGENEHLHGDGITEYINHSCIPNCEVIDKFKLVAKRDIVENEEITFDYAITEGSLDFECLCSKCSNLFISRNPY